MWFMVEMELKRLLKILLDCSKEIYEILSALSKSNKRVPHPYHTTKGLLIMPAGIFCFLFGSYK